MEDREREEKYRRVKVKERGAKKRRYLSIDS